MPSGRSNRTASSGATWAVAHSSAQAGFAVEFQGHREYVPGDDPRHIDWRVFYRHERFVVKQYQLETNFVCHLLLDVSASMRYGSHDEQKLLYAARMATMLAYCILRQNDRVSFSTFDRRVRQFLPPSNAFEQMVKIAQHVDEQVAEEGTDLARCVADLAPRFGRHAIVIVLSDLLGDLTPLEQALQRLRFARHEVVLLQILAHDELTFPLQAMTKFVALEGAQQLRAHPADLRQGYLEALDRFQARLQQMAQQNAVEHMVFDTAGPVGEALVDYMNRRTQRVRQGRGGEITPNTAPCLPPTPHGK